MEEPTTPSTLSFFYEKAGAFQTFHVDGAFGGISQRLYINMAVFAERGPIPRRTDYELEANGKLGREVARDGKKGILRELQCNLMMDYRAASVVHKWLGEKLAELDNIRKMLESEAAGAGEPIDKNE
jgi:hypothetical protein